MKRSKAEVTPVSGTIYKESFDDPDGDINAKNGKQDKEKYNEDGKKVGKRLKKGEKKTDDDGDKGSEGEEAARIAPPPVGMIEMFRFAEGIEWFMIFVGILAGWGSGLSMPAMTILFGRLTNALVNYGAYHTDPSDIPESCLEYMQNASQSNATMNATLP